MGEEATAHQEIISWFQLCRCEVSLCYQQPSGPRDPEDKFRNVASLLLITQLIL